MRQVPDWPEYHMNMAIAAAKRSKDPNTNVGCYIVDEDNRPVGAGYNGFPAGILETEALWQRPVKYDWVCHAEANAILNSAKNLKGCRLFSTLYPCKECAKLIASSKISKVYYLDHTLKGQSYLCPISTAILTAANIEIIQVKID